METEQTNVELVVIGHVTRDLAPDGVKIGGAAAYASLVATRLGVCTALVTRAAAEFDLSTALPGVRILGSEGGRTTVFKHQYELGRRIQYVHERAAEIAAASIPVDLLNARMLFLGPVIGEIEPEVAARFPRATVCVAAQGWLRRLAPDRLVEEGHMEDLDLDALLGHVTALVLSQEDLAGKPVPDAWTSAIPVLVLTKGRAGLRLHHAGRWWDLAAFPAVERDPTGAGDAFAVAFLLRYTETHDVAEAARFAAATASFIVEARGIEGAPSRAAVEGRLREHPEIRLVPRG